MQRQARIAAQVQSLQRSGHHAQIDLARVIVELHFGPADAGRPVPPQRGKRGVLAHRERAAYMVRELWFGRDHIVP
jgi:hypothetical protein